MTNVQLKREQKSDYVSKLDFRPIRSSHMCEAAFSLRVVPYRLNGMKELIFLCTLLDLEAHPGNF